MLIVEAPSSLIAVAEVVIIKMNHLCTSVCPLRLVNGLDSKGVYFGFTVGNVNVNKTNE